MAILTVLSVHATLIMMRMRKGLGEVSIMMDRNFPKRTRKFPPIFLSIEAKLSTALNVVHGQLADWYADN